LDTKNNMRIARLASHRPVFVCQYQAIPRSCVPVSSCRALQLSRHTFRVQLSKEKTSQENLGGTPYEITHYIGDTSCVITCTAEFVQDCAGTLLLGRMVAHDFDLNTRMWYFVANGVIACACLAEVRPVLSFS
jgi:hypothetical protein